MLHLFKETITENGQVKCNMVDTKKLSLAGHAVRFNCSVEDTIREAMKSYAVVDDANYRYDVRVDFDIDSTGVDDYVNLVSGCTVTMMPRMTTYKLQRFESRVFCMKRQFPDVSRPGDFTAICGPVHLGLCEHSESSVCDMFFETDEPIYYWNTLLQNYHVVDKDNRHFDAGIIYRSHIEDDGTLVFDNIRFTVMEPATPYFHAELYHLRKQVDDFCRWVEHRTVR